MTSPMQRYQQDLARQGFVRDASQQRAVEHLQRLYDELLQSETRGRRTFFQLMGVGRKNLPPVKGLYFWGGVGRGKTYLMDIFYEALPFERKMRVHFHRFMRRIHRELKTLDGVKNPLEKVADRIVHEARIICFDEFFVSDITDAMLLGTLMEKLFDRGVTLVATSNIVPERLYENGLQRARFLPAIQLICQHTEVVNVDGGVDYRLRTLEKAELYHFPLDEQADRVLMDSFLRLAPDQHRENVELKVEGRPVRARFLADDVAWFDFTALCDGPRSQNDYIELSREFHAVLLSGVPVLGLSRDDQARRFINLVDEFYDRGVKLIISAEVAIVDLYAGGNLSFEFERTVSRLLEMQTLEYLGREHRA